MSALTPDPLDQLAETLYEALRDQARRLIRGRAVVDATDMVHEAYVRLAKMTHFESMSRTEFLALTATVIRRLLIDESRRAARNAHATRVTMSELGDLHPEGSLDLVELDEALTRLAALDARQARIVELRFFAGLSGEEVASLLGIHRRTVTREWGMARAWLKRELRS